VSAPPPHRVVLLGVAGSGKTTIGEALAAALAVPFVDADDLHPPANRSRMAQGLPLDDAARAPWLAAVHARLQQLVAQASGFVLACSLLRRAYRERLAQGLPPLWFVHLQATPATLQRRLAARQGHFFPPRLLDDQLATWEPLTAGLTVDAEQPTAAVVAAIVAQLP
jgi:gluconokinase